MTRWSIALAISLSLVGCTDDLEYGSAESQIDIDAFVVPALPQAERAEIVGRYDQLDPTDQIPRGLLEDAILYYDMNLALIPKPKYFVVTDMSLYSGKNRYWLVDVATGTVEAHKVAHGDGTDPDNNGYADTFGNVDGSHKTSLGFYLTGEIYDGTHVHSMRLDGLSRDGSVNGMANNNARSRLIVMHEATYVDDANTSQQGRSNGCLALDPEIEVKMVDRIHDGTLIYVAKAPINPPVGRGGMLPDPDPIAGEHDLDESDASGGCSTGGSGAGFLVTLALVGVTPLRRRRR